MVRKDDFKLVYYSDAPMQLFNLREDPDEIKDLSTDEEYANIRAELLRLIFDGWNPETIGQIIEESIPSKKILLNWAKKTKPKSQYLWEMKHEFNKLGHVKIGDKI